MGVNLPPNKIWRVLLPCSNRVDGIIFADVMNFLLTSDEIGFLIQGFKILEPLIIDKSLMHPMEVLVKLFS